MSDHHHPSSGYYDVEKALKYWQPMYDLDGDIEAQLLALFPEGMADNSMLDDHMAYALAQLAEGDTSFEHSLRLLGVKLRQRLLKSPADDPKHLTQEDVEGAIAYIDTLKSVKTLWKLEQPEQLFRPFMRPHIEGSEFIPWFSSLVPLLQQICLLVEDGLSTQCVVDQIQKEWDSVRRTFKEADGRVITVCFGEPDLEDALRELKKMHRRKKARPLAPSSSRSYSPQRMPLLRSSDGMDAYEQYEGSDEDIFDMTDFEDPRKAFQDEVTRNGRHNKALPLDQQRSRRDTPSHIPGNTSEISEYEPYRLINPNPSKDKEASRTLLQRYRSTITSENAKRSAVGPTSVPETPNHDLRSEIESLHPTPKCRRDREATKMQHPKALLGVQDNRRRQSTPHQLSNRSNNNERTPRESPTNGVPASSGNMDQLRPVAGEVEDPVSGKTGGPVAGEAEGPIVGQCEGQVADGQVAGQILQAGPVELAADPATPPAPPGKAKSRKASRHTSRYTPYGRPGRNSARSGTVRGRRSRRSPSRSEDEAESQADPHFVNLEIEEVSEGVTTDIFRGRLNIPKDMDRDRRLRLIAKQKEMLGYSQGVYQLGQEKHRSAMDGALAAQREKFNKGLLAGLEYDEMMMEFEMEDG